MHKDNTLPIYSAAAGNEGCHLYGYRIVQLKRHYHEKSVEEKLAMNEDNRFLLLSFFLSFILLSDVNQCFIKVFRETMKELGLKEPTPKKYFNAFLLDEGKRREEASRMAYNTQFYLLHERDAEKYRSKRSRVRGIMFHRT